MVVSEGAINNIMGGMENTAGVRLHSHRHKLKQRFDIVRKLGQGTYGKVQLAMNKETGQEVAIKTIKKAKIETEQDLIRIRREIQIMSSVQHPQIIHIYEVFENREKMVLVMEYAAGGELYDYLSERKVLPEKDARRVFRQVASATYYCHKHKICHRDLKLENILLDLDGNAKIADFGLSNVFEDKHRLQTFCGSPLYASPEIVKGIPYVGPEVDCWSLGVLLYTLVYGAMPFDGSNFRRLVKQITQGEFYEPASPSNASELIQQMLTVSASERATIEDICSHWWVNEGYSESCLVEAELLANQTPVRLDLLLSLAPKHINSEHMLIQPDDEDSSQRSEAGRLPPELPLLPPPPPSDTAVLPSPARSQSLSALGSVGSSDIDLLLEVKKKEKEKIHSKENSVVEEEKEPVPKTQNASCKSASGSDEGEQVSHDAAITRPPVPLPEEGEKKCSVRKKELATDNDISEHDQAERRKSVKRKDISIGGEMSKAVGKSEISKSARRREGSIEKDAAMIDKPERKKLAKKRESSLTRESSGEQHERSDKKKELSRKSSKPYVSSSQVEVYAKENISPDTGRFDGQSLEGAVIKPSVFIPVSGEGGADNENFHVEDALQNLVSDSPVKSTNEGTVKEHNQEVTKISSSSDIVKSTSETQDMETESASEIANTTSGIVIDTESKEAISTPSDVPIIMAESQSKVHKMEPYSTLAKADLRKMETVVAESTAKVPVCGAITEQAIDKTPYLKETESISAVKESIDEIGHDTAKILQETADKIKQAEKSLVAKSGEDGVALIPQETDSLSSKESSQGSSVLSTPSRSRAGSESSTDTRSSRPEVASRRQSKIFSKAAMWDNMMSQSQDKQPASSEKVKKIIRPTGLNMSDLAKRFEEKPTADRKPKVSDARKNFENKSAERTPGPRRKSSISGNSDSSVITSPAAGDSSRNISPVQSKLAVDSVNRSASKEKASEAAVDSNLAATDIPIDVTTKESTLASDVLNIDASSNSSDFYAKPAQPIKEKTVSDDKKEKSPTKEPKVKNKSPARDKERPYKETSPVKTAVGSLPKSRTKEVSPKPEGKIIKKDKPVNRVVEMKERENVQVEMDNKTELQPKISTTSVTTGKKCFAPVPPPGNKSSLQSDAKSKPSNEKISDAISHSEMSHFETSDSSDSESEAERLLRLLSEKREKLEAAKREKLRKVSEAREREAGRCEMPAIREEPPSKLSSDSPEKLSHQAPELSGQKYATLPRGFKARPEKQFKQSTVTSTISKSKDASLEEAAGRKSSAKTDGSTVAKTAASSGSGQPDTRKRTEVEIILSNKKKPVNNLDGSVRSSYAEIQMGSPVVRQMPRQQEYCTEVRHSVSSPRGSLTGVEPQLQRAKRERIIPIMLEEDDDDDDDEEEEDDKSTSESHQVPLKKTVPYAGRFQQMSSPVSASNSAAVSDHRKKTSTSSPEPIRKCRRERIIPIAVEGEGVVSPPPHLEDAATHPTFLQPHSSHSCVNRGRGFLLDHSESFSSAGEEEEEEDEDDGFQILTAESLFSTLLNRVRSLTRKMNTDDIRSGERSHRSSHQPTPELHRTGHHPVSDYQSSHASSGFWSSLHMSPRDSPPKRVSETASQSSLSHDGPFSSPLWSHSVSREASDVDTIFSEPSAPFTTLPRATPSLLHSVHTSPASRLLHDPFFFSDIR